MLITFKCHHCAQEFEADGLQAQETCPHCQAVNQVLAHGHYADGPAEVPPPHFTASSANAAVRPSRVSSPDQPESVDLRPLRRLAAQSVFHLLGHHGQPRPHRLNFCPHRRTVRPPLPRCRQRQRPLSMNWWQWTQIILAGTGALACFIIYLCLRLQRPKPEGCWYKVPGWNKENRRLKHQQKNQPMKTKGKRDEPQGS